METILRNVSAGVISVDGNGVITTINRAAEKYGAPGNYVNGANIAGFLKVADAMMDQGLV